MSSKFNLLAGAQIAFKSRFDAILAIIVDGHPTVIIDGRSSPPVITEKENLDIGDATCVWRVEEETLSRVFEGERAFTNAFLSGRLKIDGDMAVMARLELETKS